MTHNDTIAHQAENLVRQFTELEAAITSYANTRNPDDLCRFDEIQNQIAVGWTKLTETVEQLDARQVRLFFEARDMLENKVTSLQYMNSLVGTVCSLLAKLRDYVVTGSVPESGACHAMTPDEVFEYTRRALTGDFFHFDWHADSETQDKPEPDLSEDSAKLRCFLSQPQLEELDNLAGSDFFDNSMKKLTTQGRAELIGLLHHISNSIPVETTVIAAARGMWISSKTLADVDAETLGVWALGVYMNTEHIVQKLGGWRLHQIVCKTDKDYLVIADFGDGLLVVVADEAYNGYFR